MPADDAKSHVALSQIIDCIRPHVISIIGSSDRPISGFQPFEEAANNTLAFFSYPEKIPASFDGVVICKPSSLPEKRNTFATYIVSDNPRLAMIMAMRCIHGVEGPPGVDPSAAVSSAAALDNDVGVGAFCTIEQCVIRSGTRIRAGCHIQEGTFIGRAVVIDSGVVIGAQGFGFERDREGVLHRFPHVGSVVIGDNVEIGANATIDRGTMHDTVIESGVKIDNGAYIAHNVFVRRDTMIMANAVLCGSVRVGRRCWIAPGAVIRDGVSIGDDATVGLGAVVLHDVKAHQIVAGNPARPLTR
jgi:UDP-3-O-[3-hydroxymyristoyl] glucosamine N-acyltransferase